MFNKELNQRATALCGTATINDKPEFIRLPLPGRRCPFTGLSRTTLCELTIDSEANGFSAPVRSHVLRKRGAMRGIRLISYDSLMDYLRSLPADACSLEEEGAR